MSSYHDRRRPFRAAPDGELPPDAPEPVYFRPNPNAGNHILRERALFADDLPFGGSVDYDQIAARYHLEQVGVILRRLELDQAEIDRLRTETRTALAGLAA